MYLLFIVPIIILIWIYWRYFYFFRDPDRVTPIGQNIVSVADGTVVYIRKIKGNEVPISIKKKNKIYINDIIPVYKQLDIKNEDKYIIGVFMYPYSVHVNRAPISGRVVYQQYISNKKNLPMTLMWFRALIKLKPYEKYSNHILENERNITQVLGDIPVTIIQIADIYVNKIVSFIKKEQVIKKGDKIGLLKMG